MFHISWESLESDKLYRNRFFRIGSDVDKILNPSNKVKFRLKKKHDQKLNLHNKNLDKWEFYNENHR